MSRRILICLGLLCSAFLLPALDFGLVLNQAPRMSDGEFVHKGNITPWFSAPLGQTMEIYLSAVLRTEFENEEFSFTPELGRFELQYRPTAGRSLSAGRVFHRDITGFVSSGLRDGLLFDYYSGANRVRAGFFYTGLLYKKTADIVMSGSDLADYNDKDNYWAPSRVLASIDLSMPALLGDRHSLNLGLLAQFDLRGGADTLDSQYLLVNLASQINNKLYTDVNLVLSLSQSGRDSQEFALAAKADLNYYGLARRDDRLFGGVHFGTGKTGPFQAFIPMSAVPEGEIFTPKLSGLLDINTGYGMKFAGPSLGELYGEVKATYFIRTDTQSLYDAELDPTSDSYFLGGEIFASLLWSPLSDVSLRAGAGVFFPGLGGAFMEDAAVRWLASLTLILSF